MPAGQVAYNTPTKNPYYQYQHGPDLGYQEHLQNLIFGIGPEKSGLYDFMRGGAYGPEALMAMAPQVNIQAPTPGSLQGYARAYMDPVAAQNAILASQLADVGGRMGTTAGRSAAAMQLGRGLSANVGQAGVAGAGAGLDAMLRANMQTQLSNQQSRLGLLQQGVGQAYGASQGMNEMLINAITNAQARREQERMMTRQQNMGIIQQIIGGAGRIAGAAATGGLGGGNSYWGGYEQFPGAYSNQDFYQSQMNALAGQRRY